MTDFSVILSQARICPEFQEWALPTKLVAEGFGCGVEAIRSHKSRNASELREGRHWIKRIDDDNIARIYWSRRGIIRLGFLIDSDRAKQFRDVCEDFVLSVQPEPPTTPENDQRCNPQHPPALTESPIDESPSPRLSDALVGLGTVIVQTTGLFFAILSAPFWLGRDGSEQIESDVSDSLNPAGKGGR